MRASWSVSRWLRIPSRLALLLGLGALSTVGTGAGAAEAHPGARSPHNPGEATVRLQDGRIYLSEGGGVFEELRLADSAPARLLQQLLESRAAEGEAIRLHPMILAGSGGDGFHGAPPSAESATETAPAPRTGHAAIAGQSRGPAASGDAKQPPADKRS